MYSSIYFISKFDIFQTDWNWAYYCILITFLTLFCQQFFFSFILFGKFGAKIHCGPNQLLDRGSFSSADYFFQYFFVVTF